MLAVSRSTCRWLALGGFFLFYLTLGASVFSAIESPIERDAAADLVAKRRRFIERYPCVEGEDLDGFVSAVVEANSRGVPLPNATAESFPPSWSFGQSFFFASTVVTTIGYGHQSPLSTSGKMFCMVYAAIGIPLTLLFLAASVEKLLVPSNLLLEWINAKMDRSYTAFSIRLLHLLCVVALVVAFLFLLPALAFTALEPKWHFSDSLYYCFVSLTTIGLGDFIPGDNPDQPLRPLYKACTTFYLLIGVTAMMMTLSVFYSIPEFDLPGLFLLSCAAKEADGDPEKMLLQTPGGAAGPTYTRHTDENNAAAAAAAAPAKNLDTRRVVRAKSRPGDDTPPEDN